MLTRRTPLWMNEFRPERKPETRCAPKEESYAECDRTTVTPPPLTGGLRLLVFVLILHGNILKGYRHVTEEVVREEQVLVPYLEKGTERVQQGYSRDGARGGGERQRKADGQEDEADGKGDSRETG